MVRLNGWQRLWIVVSAVYLLVVSAVVALFWPSPETTFHRDEFINRMLAESRLVLRSIYAGEYAARDDSAASPSVKMPNGAL